MIKLVIFDLDGVLIDAKKIHFDALNIALGEYAIEWNQHLSIYDGLKTKQKLKILSERKNLPASEHNSIWNEKQKITLKKIKNLTPDEKLISLMKKLTQENYKIAVCTNSIRKTAIVSLSRIGVIEYIDIILSNEDVSKSKPHPEIYWKAMTSLHALPAETLIVEDSPVGLLAAKRSAANVLRVKNTKEVDYKKIKGKIMQLENNQNLDVVKWHDEKLNILIPMAGAGSRFEKAGYTFPKPLIEVNGKPMIQVVIENLNIDANFIFVVQKEHREKYNLDALLGLIAPNSKIVETDGITEGAACTALLAKEYINTDSPLFFANSDQFVDWNSSDFMYKMNESGLDGGIVTFNSTHPKWSFAKVNSDGYVTEVAEKKPISNLATVGFYYWKKGSDFVKYAESMINKNIRVNNEFYVCPVFNEALKDNKKIITYNIKKMWGLGTPEDLNYYLNDRGVKK